MTAKYAPRVTRPVVSTRRRVDDEYSFSPQTIYRVVGGVAAVGVLLVVVALFSSGRPSATLTGRVSHRGKPVIWGSVILYGPDGSATAGRIETDGTYSVKDAPPVTVTVAVVSRDPWAQHVITQHRTDRNRVKSIPPAPVDRKQWFPLPKQYEDVRTSGLTVNLTKGTNQHDIELP